MIDKLPIWYKPLTLKNISENTFKSRNSEIKKLSKTKGLEWMLDCLRVYLGLPTETEQIVNDIKTHFGKTDSFFIQNDSKLEVQVLAGAMVYDFIFSKQKQEYNKLALITKSAMFQRQEPVLNRDIIEDIEQYLVREGNAIRNQQLTEINYADVPHTADIVDLTSPNVNNKIKGIINQFNGQIRLLNKQINYAGRTINFLREESNILWWSFGSETNGKARRNIPKYYFPYQIAVEIAGLINAVPPPSMINQFIKKSVADAGFSEIKEPFIEFIDGIDLEECKKYLQHYSTTYNNLLPVHYALYQKSQAGGDKSWVVTFENNISFKASNETSLTELLEQFLLEHLVLISK